MRSSTVTSTTIPTPTAARRIVDRANLASGLPPWVGKAVGMSKDSPEFMQAITRTLHSERDVFFGVEDVLAVEGYRMRVIRRGNEENLFLIPHESTHVLYFPTANRLLWIDQNDGLHVRDGYRNQYKYSVALSWKFFCQGDAWEDVTDQGDAHPRWCELVQQQLDLAAA